MRRAWLSAVVLVAAAAITGCAGDDDVRGREPTSPLEPCTTVAMAMAPTVVPTIPPAVSPAPASAQLVPVAALPCFTGDRTVDLTRLGRPAVINLWASWCAPCRVELPEFQRFADAAGDDLVVLGVVTGDTKASAASAAKDFGITFPALFDPDGKLLSGLSGVSLARHALPVTIFVDAQGRVRHVYQRGDPLTLSTLEGLTRQHLGVEVS